MPISIETSKPICSFCSSDLTQDSSVSREYVNKDSSSEDSVVSCLGYFKKDRFNEYFFEPQTNCDLSSGRFDLLDDSDSCSSCENKL